VFDFRANSEGNKIPSETLLSDDSRFCLGNICTPDMSVNAQKTKYMVMSRDQNAGQNGYIQIGNESFETVERFKYLGTTITN
jgi:hypothetical protein